MLNNSLSHVILFYRIIFIARGDWDSDLVKEEEGGRHIWCYLE